MQYDVIVIGSGGAGIMAAIAAAKNSKKVLLLEKLSTIGAKLKASGGGKCNITNTLELNEFLQYFGKNGRFIRDALTTFSSKDLREFLKEIGVPTHAPDGFRVFPTTHNAATIVHALEQTMHSLGVTIKLNTQALHLIVQQTIQGVQTTQGDFFASSVVIATGGKGYPMLGTTGDGYTLAQECGHTITTLYPAMLPLHTKEQWVDRLRANTIAKATLKIDLKKYKKLKAVGDLIFTKNGLRGPVILDFAREITPLLKTHKEVPIVANLTQGMNENDALELLKRNSHKTVFETLTQVVPKELATIFCELSNIALEQKYKQLQGSNKEKLVKLLAWTPLTVIGHDGFKKAMVTRGGVKLKEIDPKTMQSKLINGLYFCGEVLDIDGACGGYNLQYCFSSGYLCGVNI